jgi:hypothetical protein
MQLRSILMVALAAVFALSLSVPGMAQDDGNFMVRYGSNLTVGTAPNYTNPLITTMTNTGGGWGEHLPLAQAFPSFNGVTLISNGNICVNIYAFSADEQLQWCCQCTLTPNALGSFSTNDLQTHLLTGIGNSQAALNIKLVATALGTVVDNTGRATSTQTVACDATTVGLSTIPGQFFPDPVGPVVPPSPTGKGLAAWARNNLTETPYTHSTLSSLELQHNSQFCAFNKVNGSGVGYCATTLFTQTAASTTVAQCPRAIIL